MEKAKKIIAEFGKNEGPKLQRYLEERAKKEINWVSLDHIVNLLIYKSKLFFFMQKYFQFEQEDFVL